VKLSPIESPRKPEAGVGFDVPVFDVAVRF
jgi:hypothetical protein